MRDLTPTMRATLSRRQPDMFGAGAIVEGPGMTMKGLRKRGLVEGAMPRARVTPLGEQVIEVAAIDDRRSSG